MFVNLNETVRYGEGCPPFRVCAKPFKRRYFKRKRELKSGEVNITVRIDRFPNEGVIVTVRTSARIPLEFAFVSHSSLYFVIFIVSIISKRETFVYFLAEFQERNKFCANDVRCHYGRSEYMFNR